MTLEEHFTEENILESICKIRAKLSKQRSNKHLIHLLSKDENTNYHINHEKNSKFLDNDLILLNSIMPSRRKWKKLDKKNRYLNNHQKLNSVDYNKISLIKTINYYKKNNPTEPFLINLNKFIQEIQASIWDKNFSFIKPKIIPQVKSAKDVKCRPISLFNLKDRIIISLTNRYLSKYFDDFFYVESHAFRPKRIYKNKITSTSHHHAIDSIMDYRNNYKGKKLYVSECDISKFYDSVNHTIIKRNFNKLLSQGKTIFDEKAKSIFYKYLDSYSFVHDVRIYNDKVRYANYWNDYNKKNCYYGWIDDEIKEAKYYKQITRNRIGVPQGGAISGFIANLMLHFVDLELMKYKDKKLHYVRFCDDMIIIHPYKKLCEKYYNIYQENLIKIKLIPHKPAIFDFKHNNDFKKFWSDKIKSKKPYKWSSVSNNSTHWVGFVGYEISYNNEVRVRKSSLIKEKNKQRELVETTIKTLRNGQRKSKDTIIESVCNRLIGMSVGRVNIKNYNFIENDFCWVKDFNRLKANVQIKKQLRNLDNYRNKQVSILKKEINGAIKQNDIFIPKYLFTCIPSISISDSENIRNELVSLQVLTKKFKLTNKKFDEINQQNFKLTLSNKFTPKERIILKVLISFKQKERNVNYYGKPYSYYYHLIEKDS